MNGGEVLGVVAGLVVILLGLGLFVWWHRGDRHPPQVVPGGPTAPVCGGESMPETPVASSEADYRFLLGGRVFWQALHSGGLIAHADPRALARDVVARRAATVTGRVSPTDPALAGHRVAAELGVRQADANRQLLAWATDVTIRIPDEDADRLHRLAELRKTVQVWEHERGHERNVREYLGNEVLTSTGKAVVWWLARNDENVERAVGLLATLDQLSAAAQDRLQLVAPSPLASSVDGDELDAAYGPAAQPELRSSDPLQELADQLFPEHDDARRKFFAHDLARLAEAHELSSFSARVREVFDLPDLAAPSSARDGAAPWDGEDVPPDQRTTGDT